MSEKQIRRLDRKRAHQSYSTSDGKKVVGASTVAKFGEDSGGLLYWAYGCGKSGVDFKKVRDEAADIGTTAHFLIETFLGGFEPDLSEMSQHVIDVARRAYGNFLDYWTLNEFRPVYSELQMVSEQYGYGGTLDCIARDKNERLVLLDFKVTGGFYVSQNFQLSGYRNLFHENNPMKVIDRSYIVRIPKEQGERVETKEFYSMDKQFAVFLAQLNLYKKLQECKGK